MTAFSPADLRFNRTELRIDLIVHDDEILRLDPVVLRERRHGPTRSVHVAPKFRQNHSAAGTRRPHVPFNN